MAERRLSPEAGARRSSRLGAAALLLLVAGLAGCGDPGGGGGGGYITEQRVGSGADRRGATRSRAGVTPLAWPQAKSRLTATPAPPIVLVALSVNVP